MNVTPETFKFISYFDGLTREQYQQCIENAHVMFYGVLNYLWGIMDEPIRSQKRELCFNYIVAWYIAQNYPSSLVGMMSNPMPMDSKSIKNVHLKFSNILRQETGLDLLASNPFGVQALTMIQAAPECFLWR